MIGVIVDTSTLIALALATREKNVPAVDTHEFWSYHGGIDGGIDALVLNERILGSLVTPRLFAGYSPGKNQGSHRAPLTTTSEWQSPSCVHASRATAINPQSHLDGL